jgi:leucine dehydrogenase
MSVFELSDFDNHENIVFCHDSASGLKAIIAIHNTALGPAMGGCRMWPYPSEQEALTDVLRLSRGMSLKNALADLAHGGGKAVIIADPKTDKTEALFRALGRAINRLGGAYVTAEDVGTTSDDMAIVARETQFVSGLEGEEGASGDPSAFTARGVFLGIQESVRFRLGRSSLEGVVVAVQGLGNVGGAVCKLLHDAGAKLIVTDIDPGALEFARKTFGATVVGTDEIFSQAADVFCPCALGGAINESTIVQLQAPVIAGSANNQLAEQRFADALVDLEILYAPDYVINAGGVINVAAEVDGAYDRARVMDRIDGIPVTLHKIFERAQLENKSPDDVAEKMALEKLSAPLPHQSPYLENCVA